MDKHGFIVDALPENYVDDPPNDIDAVESNLLILQDVLNPTIDKFNVKGLISRLQDLVYPRITEFLENGVYILAQRIGKSHEEIGLAEIQTIIHEQPEQFGPSDLVWMDNLVKDLQYLVEMRKMEDPDYGKNNPVSFHIVPISGLILSHFCRLENEAKTALELWKRVRPDLDMDSGDASTSTSADLEAEAAADARADAAVLAQLFVDMVNVKSNEELIDMLQQRSTLLRADGSPGTSAAPGGSSMAPSEPLALNAQDQSGWTALHVTCSNSDKLTVASRLLDEKDLDVTCQNADGNSALHYLVRLRCGANKRELRLDVLRKLLSRDPEGVHRHNKNGETPLHAACFSGNLDTCELLLDAHSDPNARTVSGETPLHLAVRRANITMVQALMAHGALVNVLSDKGETPLAIAQASKKTEEIAKVLQGLPPPTSSPTSQASSTSSSPSFSPLASSLESAGDVARSSSAPSVQDDESCSNKSGTQAPIAGTRAPAASFVAATAPSTFTSQAPRAPDQRRKTAISIGRKPNPSS